MTDQIDLNLLLNAYAMGIFPMADDRDAPDIYWVEPKKRAILPLDQFHLSRSLRKTLKSGEQTITLVLPLLFLVGTILGGPIGDRFSKRYVIAGSLFVWSAVTWWTGHVTTFNELVAARAADHQPVRVQFLFAEVVDDLDPQLARLGV